MVTCITYRQAKLISIHWLPVGLLCVLVYKTMTLIIMTHYEFFQSTSPFG